MKKRKIHMSIKMQLVIGFVCPIIFIIIVGLSAYMKASSGMISLYTNSVNNTMEVTLTSFERAFRAIETTAISLSLDNKVLQLGMGNYDNNTSGENNARTEISNKLASTQTTDNFIQDIHILPYGKGSILTTAKLGTQISDHTFVKLLYEEEIESTLFEQAGVQWSGKHPYVDERLSFDSEEYAMTCSMRLGNAGQCGVLLIDIRTQEIIDMLNQIDFGENSASIFITNDHTFLNIPDNLLPEKESIEELILQIEQNENVTGTLILSNMKYHYFYVSNERIGFQIVTLVPENLITKETNSIRNITIFMILLSSLLGCILAYLIIFNIKIGRAHV